LKNKILNSKCKILNEHEHAVLILGMAHGVYASFFILLQPAFLLGLPPGGLEEGAVEEEAGLELPGVVEGTGLVGGVLPPVDVLPPEEGWVVGGSVLPDVVLLSVGDVVWTPPVELGVGVVWEPPVELGAGALVGPIAVNVSFETWNKQNLRKK